LSELQAAARDGRTDPRLDPHDATDVVLPPSSPVGLRAEAAGLLPAALRDTASWRPVLRPYERADWRSAVQLLSALAMFVGGWVLAVRALEVHYALTLLASVPIAVAVVRCFIIFHDCGHGSFSASRRLNDVVGTALGIVVFTPFRYWNYAHAMHHATSSDLDRRGVGDVWTMTVAEYRTATALRRLLYRINHSPWFLLTLAPLLKFGIIERIVTRPSTTPKRVKRSVHLTNAGIVAFVVAMCVAVGPWTYIAVQLPVLVIGGSGAIWLFYVQHRFDGAHWTRRADWRYVDAGLLGSSHLDLGPVLRYVSGNIGFHHLHHLDARIPNYNLPRCSREHPELRAGAVLTLRQSLGARHLKLWDEAAGRYVSYEAVGR
jgi:omega-6 fatty acid desaturase (delta-12 desaturase)